MDKIPILLKAIIVAINLIACYYLVIADFIKISEETSNKLNVTFRPIISLGIGIIISQLVILFFFKAFTFIPSHKIICEHSIQYVSTVDFDLNTKKNKILTDCKITDIDWFNREKNTKIISNLLEAKIKQRIEMDEHNKKNYSYRIFLLSKTETIPFADYEYINFKINELRLLTSSINDFLVNNKGKILVRIVDNSYIGYFGFGCSILCGLIILLLTSAGLFINFCFDKETNLLTVSRYRCFGLFGKESLQYSLNEIIDVKNERIVTSSDEYRNRVIILVPGNKLLLTPKMSFSKSVTMGFYSKEIKKEDYIVRVIKDFLEIN